MHPALFALALAGLVSGANLRMFDALLPSVAESFGVAPTIASVVVTAFTLAYGSSQLIHGPLADRIGKLRVVAIASFIAAAASLGSMFVTSLSGLTVMRFATGIGAGGMIPLALAWIGDNTPYDKRQATLGRFIGVILVGHVVGPVVAGALAHFVSWRAVFGIFTGLFLITGIVLWQQHRKSAPLPARNKSTSGVFAVYRMVLCDRWVCTVLATVFIEGALFYGAFAYTGAYLKERFGLSYFTIGAIIAAFGLGGMAYSLSVRWLLRRLGEAGLVTTGSAMLLLCYLLLPWLPYWQPFVPLLVLAGVGFYMFHNTLQTRSTEMAPQARGTALSLHAFAMFIGQAAGVAIFGAGIRASNYAWAFVIAGIGLYALGQWFSYRVRRHISR
jgi:predicted MFS family arabinose efflux permease